MEYSKHVVIETEVEDEGPDCVLVPVCRMVYTCADTHAVYNAIRTVETHQNEWSVWELVDGQYKQRAVVSNHRTQDVTIFK